MTAEVVTAGAADPVDDAAVLLLRGRHSALPAATGCSRISSRTRAWASASSAGNQPERSSRSGREREAACLRLGLLCIDAPAPRKP